MRRKRCAEAQCFKACKISLRRSQFSGSDVPRVIWSLCARTLGDNCWCHSATLSHTSRTDIGCFVTFLALVIGRNAGLRNEHYLLQFQGSHHCQLLITGKDDSHELLSGDIWAPTSRHLDQVTPSANHTFGCFVRFSVYATSLIEVGKTTPPHTSTKSLTQWFFHVTCSCQYNPAGDGYQDTVAGIRMSEAAGPRKHPPWEPSRASPGHQIHDECPI